MEKECKICGKFFETNNANRLCCDDCSEHYNQRRREYANAYAASKRRMWGAYEPERIEKICDQCGRQYTTIRRLLITWDDKNVKKFFCCREHKTDYVAERTFCSVCGESMKGHGFSLNNSGPFYCSPECAEKGRWGIARANGQIKKCEYCGKEFINKKKEGGYFCCNDCYRAAVKEGWRSPKKQQVSNVIRNCTCVVCGRTVEVECDPDNLVSAFGFTCSDECRKKYDELKSLKTKKATKPVVQKRTEIKKDLDSITTALCADCRVSYKDCVRMQTQFRVLPKGAHYNNKGVLVICPDYLPPRRKGA